MILLLFRIILPSLLLGEMAARAQSTKHNFHAPNGFEVKRAAASPAIRFPMFAAFDNQRRLFVAESSGLDLYEELQKLTRRCRISLLQDLDQDGVFESTKMFADHLVFPMGLAWREGKLYVADPPDVITLEDTDGDGRADKRTVLLSGFGHTDNGSVHGLTFGPDGWLYLTMGQPDGFRITRADGQIIEGKSGALLRCRADGSGLEVVCRGFENLVEVAFLPTGEIIGTDNWFFLPQDGVRDALVHLVPGGVYPLDAHAAFERQFFFSGEYLPPLQTYPAVAHSGLMRYTGTAFPLAMRGSFFSAQFNTRKIVRHELTRHGATFQSADEDFLTTDDPDFHPSDVLEDADGSMLVVDTGSWYTQHCPTGRIRQTPAEGGIFRIRYQTTTSVAQTPEADWSTQVRQEVMSNAAFSFDALTNSPEKLTLALRALHPSSLGAPDSVGRMLAHPAPFVRLAAAEKLAAMGNAASIPAIVQTLTTDTEPFLVHALLNALHRCASTQELMSLLEHSHASARRAALILLNQPPHQQVPASAAFAALNSHDPALRKTGIAILKTHPKWNAQASDYIQVLLTQTNVEVTFEALGELLPTFARSPGVAELVAKSISDLNRPATNRAALLEVLAQSGVAADASVREALRSSETLLVKAGLRVLQNARINGFDVELGSLAHDPERDKSLRLDALRLLIRQKSKLDQKSFALLHAALSLAHSPADRLTAAEILSTSELDSAQFLTFIQFAERDPLISPALLAAAAQRASDNVPTDTLIAYFRARVDSGWQMPESNLEWLARAHPNAPAVEHLRKAMHALSDRQLTRLKEIEPLLRDGDPNAGHQLFLTKLACSTCHRVGKIGGMVGPDLTRIGAVRSGRDLIESLVMPSATFAQGYDTFQVTLKNGDSLSGIRVRQADDAFVLRDASGVETRMNADQIEKTERLQHSLMPEALLAGSSSQDVRDLLAYLQSLK